MIAAFGIIMVFVLQRNGNHDLKDPRRSKIDKEIIAKYEDPGAFYDALSELRTTKEGITYESGYMSRELKKAYNRLSRSRSQNAPLDWKERGPVNISGRARALIIDPSDPDQNTWWMGSVGGGVWKTSDGGTSWENKTPDLLTLTTTTIAICQSNPEVMYVGTGMGYGRIVDLAGSGIWKSIDHGETWFQLESTANDELLDAINRIVVDPQNPDIVLACSNGHTSHLGPKSGVNGNYGSQRKSGIFRSEDGGVTWTKVFDGDEEIDPNRDNRVQQILPDPTDFNILYATVNEGGVIKSTDKGLTWSLTSGQFTRSQHIGVPQRNGFGLSGISSRSEIAISPSDPNRIYAAVERPNTEPADLYMSTNAGSTWSEVTDTGSDPSWFGTNGGLDRNAGWFDNTIIVHPFDPNIVFVGGVNIYRINVNSTNATRTTTPIAWWIPNNQGIPFVHADHHWLVTIPVDESANSFKLLSANDGGYCISNDGGNNWVQKGGVVTTQFYAADKKPDEDVYIGGLQDNSTLVSGSDPDQNSTWNLVIGGDGVEVVWHYTDPNLVLGCSQNGNISKSYDGGQTFTLLNQARKNFQTGPFLTKIANSKSDPDLIFVVGDGGVNRSDDFGETWTTTVVPGNWLGFRPFDNVEVSLADPRVVWISSRLDVDPASGVAGGIYVSRDGGLNFTDISSNFPQDVTESSGLGTHPDDPATAYFLFAEPGHPKILKTTDYGQSFEDISGFSDAGTGRFNDRGFPDVSVFSLLVMPYNDQIIWAGTEIGLFVSEDGGQSWMLSDSGVPHVGIFQMSIVDGQIVVATQGRGVWTVEIPELQGHQPKSVTLVPRIEELAMLPSNEYVIALDLRSEYDSTELYIDGEITFKFDANVDPEKIQKFFVPTEDKLVTVQAISYANDEMYASGVKTLNVFEAEPVKSFITKFEDAQEVNRFLGTNFNIRIESGFSDAAAHTIHPYNNASNAILLLKSPIVVAEQNATLKYKDVALIEPGAGNSTDHNDPNFFDFVIVEGSKNGSTWNALAPGYDARANASWLSTYNSALSGQNSTASGTSSLYVQQSIDLLQSFNAGDTIFIRFRLSSDPLAFGWGWAIDDVVIQTEDTTGGGNEVTSVSVEDPWSIELFPNPFTDHVNINIDNHEVIPIQLSIVNLQGKVVDQKQLKYGKDIYNTSYLDNGLYLMKLERGNETRVFKVFKE